jgi:hypothetical protein
MLQLVMLINVQPLLALGASVRVVKEGNISQQFTTKTPKPSLYNRHSLLTHVLLDSTCSSDHPPL